jgi:hypothetical protein
MKGLPAKYGGLQGEKMELAQWKLHERLGGSLEEYATRAAAVGFLKHSICLYIIEHYFQVHQDKILLLVPRKP